MATLYASFDDPALAEKAAGALMDHGVRSEDISVVANETYVARRSTMYDEPVSREYNTAVVERETTSEDVERAAKIGISTTTPGDAAVGAAKGAGIGLGVGVLAALASLVVPGFGIVIGGGALATAIAGAVGATAAGAVAGGVTGYLKDQGVPEQAIARYSDVFTAGGAILSIRVPSGDVDSATAESVLAKYGAANASVY